MSTKNKIIGDNISVLLTKNRNLRDNLENVVKLFFVTQKILKKKVRKLENIQKCSIEFLSQLCIQIDVLKDTLDENLESVYSSHNSLLIGNQKLNHNESVDLEKEEEVDAMFEKIVNGKELMQKELSHADKILKFLNQFMKDDEYSRGERMNPDEILKIIDLDEFLTKTQHFFENEKIDILEGCNGRVKVLEGANLRLESDFDELLRALKKDPNSKGLRNSIKRIITLQRALKDRDLEITSLQFDNDKLRQKQAETVKNTPSERTKASRNTEEDKQLLKENEVLKSQLKKIARQMEKLQAKTSEINEKEMNLQQELSDVIEEKEKHFYDAFNLKNKLIVLQERLTAAKDVHISLQERMLNMSKENSLLKEQLISGSIPEEEKELITQKIVELQEENQIQRNRVLELEAILEATREETYNGMDASNPLENELGQKIEELEQDNQALKLKNEFLEEKTDSLKKNNLYLEQKLQEYQDSNAFVLEESENVKKHAEVLSKALEKLKKESNREDSTLLLDFQVLKGRHNTLQHKYAELSKKTETLLIDNKSLRDHNEDLIKQTEKPSRNLQGRLVLDNDDLINMIFIQGKTIEEVFNRQD